jgi:signal transduction histidine kinase
MIRKVIVVVIVAAAVVFGLWRLGVLDDRKLKDEASDLKDRAEKGVKRAGEETAKKAREGIEDAARR